MIGTDGPTRIGLAQWHPVPGDPERNDRSAEELIERAGRAGCGLVVLPELWPSGYDPARLAEDFAASAEPLQGPRGRRLGALARAHGLWLLAGSVPELQDGVRYNTAPLYGPDGRLRARHRKFHRYAAGGEPDVFAAGEGPTVLPAGEDHPAIGLAVCYDGDFPETGRELRGAGARIVLAPAAYEYATEGWWDRLYPAWALANGQWWVQVNQAGGGAEGCFGRSRVISPLGEVVAEASRCAPGEDPDPELLTVDVDLAGGWQHAEAEGADALWGERSLAPASAIGAPDAAGAPNAAAGGPPDAAGAPNAAGGPPDAATAAPTGASR